MQTLACGQLANEKISARIRANVTNEMREKTYQLQTPVFQKGKLVKNRKKLKSEPVKQHMQRDTSKRKASEGETDTERDLQ